MESSQSIQLTPLVKSNRHGEHKNPYYHREYYLKNREKLLAYGHEYYGVKKLLKKCLRSEKKETKIGVKKISFAQAHDNNYNNPFLINSRYYGGCWLRALDKKDVRVLTKGKVPQCRGWPKLYEKLKVEDLLSKYGEWGARTGRKVGTKYYVIADLDLRGFANSLYGHLEKNFLLMKTRQGIKHIKTKRGYHDIFLLDELPPNGAIYHTDRFGVRRKIGDILSVGRQAQGLGSPDKEPAGEGKWAWQAKNIQEISKIWKKYFLEIECKENNKISTKKTSQKEVSNIKPNEREKLNKSISPNTYTKIRLEKIRIISKQLTKKTNYHRVNYCDQQKRRGFFFLDSYFRDRKGLIEPDLVGNFVLLRGYKYQFYLRSC